MSECLCNIRDSTHIIMLFKPEINLQRTLWKQSVKYTSSWFLSSLNSYLEFWLSIIFFVLWLYDKRTEINSLPFKPQISLFKPQSLHLFIGPLSLLRFSQKSLSFSDPQNHRKSESEKSQESENQSEAATRRTTTSSIAISSLLAIFARSRCFAILGAAISFLQLRWGAEQIGSFFYFFYFVV